MRETERILSFFVLSLFYQLKHVNTSFDDLKEVILIWKTNV